MKVGIVDNFNYANKFNNAPKFTSETEYGDFEPINFLFDDKFTKDEEENNLDRYEDYKNYGFYKGTLLGTAVIGMVGLMLSVFSAEKKDKKSKEFIKEVSEVVKSVDTKNVTLIIRDINKDAIPEITIINKDGSSIIIDSGNKEILK